MKGTDMDGSLIGDLGDQEMAAFEELRHPSFEVIDYRRNLDDPDIDPDPDFRAFLRLINNCVGVRTVSSCQGHQPGEQYEDVTEVMKPYVTVFGDADALVIAQKLFASVQGVERTSIAGGKMRVFMSSGVIGSWGPSLVSLQRVLVACKLLDDRGPPSG